MLVTIDIGANDLSRCVNRATGAIDLACVQGTFPQAPANLATILARLRAAAGPRVPIVGMNFYDPFLAAWLQGPDGQALARLSVHLVTQYNDLLEAAYQGAAVPVADVEAAFSTTDFDRLVTLPGVGPVPSMWPGSASGPGCAPHRPGAQRPRPPRRLLGHGRRLCGRADPGAPAGGRSVGRQLDCS